MAVPYTIIGTLVAKPETRDELQVILAGFVEPTRAEEGCINYDFHVDSEDPCTFVFYENWRSKADLDRHLAAPHLRPLFGRLTELLARPVEIKNYLMLSEQSCPSDRLRYAESTGLGSLSHRVS